MVGVELEARRYPGKTDPTGMAGRTVITSQFTGDVIDGTRLPNINDGALTEGLGDALEDNKEGMLEAGWNTISGWFD